MIARTRATDDSWRHRGIQNLIVQTSRHEYTRFAPMAMTGLPSTLETGQTRTGELTFRGVSRPGTLDIAPTPTAAGQLAGVASTTLACRGWGLSIPRVPFVASVSEQVRLELDVTARPAWVKRQAK